MNSITNDKQLRKQLDSLKLEQQRALAVKFVKSIIHLCSDKRIKKAIETAENSQSNEDDIINAYKQIKSIAAKSYTDCGSEVNWKEQAEHFVITAAMASLTPKNMLTQGKNLIWQTAMQARMAKNCEMIEKDSGDIDNEAIKQYKLAEQYFT